ncbi:hypothetical protein DVH05_025233 [Phytophthora capsici]|nr:hypothetical protein DVH05_025233 [Phytophthora capsici]
MGGEDKAPVTRVQQVSSAAFDVLKDKGVSERTLEIYEDHLLGNEMDDKTKTLTKNAVFAAYSEFINRPLSMDDFHAAANAAIEKLRMIQSQRKANPEPRKLVPEAFRLVSEAFERDYKGSADTSFQKYLARCCHTYFKYGYEEMYTAPYVTITQSSGFGKSRILKRLAEKEGVIKHDNVSFDMKVLYVCARDIEGSSGYPCATPSLCNWLFRTCTEPNLTTALKKSFKYSVENSDAKRHWMKLFEVDSGDEKMRCELEKVQLDSNSNDYPMEELHAHPTVPVLVVAIDEARALMTKKTPNGGNALQILRRALRNVNKTATVRNANGLVFGILVDTNSQVRECVPTLSQDPSSRPSSTKNMTPFPPFILTETMDIMLDDSKLSGVDTVDQKTSRSRVLTTNEKDVWTALVSMGRPLWHSLDDTTKHLSARKAILTRFAARKLLIGLDMNQQESYTDSTLHGVSSLFCRLGLRPYASSPIATRLVANFMCVLHYVGYKNDTQISGYVSEPILTFGAARMWHQFENPTHNWPSALESKILPQLETILLNGLIDTGNIGELVARIFLLLALAMDAVAMDSSDKWDFVFSGEFCDVVKFVKILVGDDPYRQKQNSMMPYEDWLESWNDWQICFSHFVDLQEEPTENVLWKLLDRRAAGTFPRGQDGADLLLPIFRPKCDSYPEGKVSFIVVQVKNRVDQDDKLPDSALRKLSCSYVFKEANTLSKLKNHEVIRLYVSLREVLDEDHFAQSIEMKEIRMPRAQKKPKSMSDFDGALCVRGVLAPGMNDRWPFLSKGVAEKLSKIASTAWWDGEVQVKCDLKSRDDHEKKTKQRRLSSVLSADDAEKTASHTLKFASKVKAQ